MNASLRLALFGLVALGGRGQQLPPEALRQDLAILKAALEEGHPGIYRYASKSIVDSRFRTTANLITRPMDAREFYRLIAPTVAIIRCGHTAPELPKPIRDEIATAIPLLPLRVKVLRGKIVVFRDYRQSDQRLAGAEILSINGTPSSRILKTLLAAVHGDGSSQTAGPRDLGRRFSFAEDLYTLAGLEAPFRVSLRPPDSSSRIEMMPGMARKEMEAFSNKYFPQDRPPQVAATFDHLNGHTSVLKISHFGGAAQGGVPLREFIQRAFEDLSRNKTADLILDLRDNGGGQDDLGRDVFSHLVAEPFAYYKELIVNKLTFEFFQYARRTEPIPQTSVVRRANGTFSLVDHPNSGEQRPRDPIFAGRVFALMNGGSFSTTCELLSNLHHRRRAVFIGEEAAGGYYGNTAGRSSLLILPNSRIEMDVRLVGLYLPIEGHRFGARSIPPDYHVVYTIRDLLRGVDKEMDLALTLANGKRGDGGSTLD